MASSEKSKDDQKSLSSGLTRRQFLPLLGATAIAAAAPGILHAAPGGTPGKPSGALPRFVYVGTYTAPGVPPGGTHPSTAVGIYVFRLDPSDGGLTPLQIVPASNPSFVALDPTLTHLYSVNEDARRQRERLRDQPGERNADLPQHRVGKRSVHHAHQRPPVGTVFLRGQLRHRQLPGLSDHRQWLDRPQDRRVPKRRQWHRAPNPARQEGPHAHQILTDLGGSHVFGVDLGADKVNALNLNLGTGLFSPNTVPFVPVASGSGPRHMAFHPDGQRAYVLDELVSTITVFNYDPVRGAFVWKQTISTLPDNFTGINTTAEIRIHPSGQFLYNTNRGHNSVTMYAIDAITGELDVIGWESTRGEWPRGMNIDPSGTFLYAANQNTDTIAVFRIQPSNGKLKFSTLVNTPTPVDVEFGSLA